MALKFAINLAASLSSFFKLLICSSRITLTYICYTVLHPVHYSQNHVSCAFRPSEYSNSCSSPIRFGLKIPVFGCTHPILSPLTFNYGEDSFYGRMFNYSVDAFLLKTD